jgi:lysophospholipase L1-like esterase
MVLVVFLSSAFLLSYLTFPVSIGSVFSPIRVACVGDSITEGSYYPSDLQGLLGKNYTVGNFGAGGSTVLFSSDKPYIYRIAFQKAMAFHADIVVIMLGTNDATPKYYGKIDNFDRDYKMLIGQFKAENPQIWLVIPRIEQVATELGLPIIDVYTLLLNHPEFFTDGVHPGSEGAETVAAAVYQAILNQAS